MNYTGKKVLVIGTGLSGIGAAQLLSREGAFVTLLDQNEKAQKEEICGRFAGTLTPEEMSRICIVIGDLPGESNTDNESPFGYEHFDQIVPSPAVPLDSPLLQKFEEEGTPIISEIVGCGWMVAASCSAVAPRRIASASSAIMSVARGHTSCAPSSACVLASQTSLA